MRPVPVVVGGLLLLTLVGATVEQQDETAGPSEEQAVEAALDKLHQARPAAAAATTVPAPGTDPSAEPGSGAPPPPPPPLAPAPAAPPPPASPPAPAPAPPAEVPDPAPAPSPEPPPPPAPPPPDGPSPGAAATLACIRDHESGGDYGVVSSNGLYHGAYQFLPSTWDAAAGRAGRPDLVGVPPEQAAPADQDAVALALLEWQGTRPWPLARCRW